MKNVRIIDYNNRRSYINKIKMHIKMYVVNKTYTNLSKKIVTKLLTR